MYSTIDRQSTKSYQTFVESPKKVSEVVIEAPGFNSRTITASVIVDRSMNSVWQIITDYNNLSTHVPNLVESYLIKSPTSGTRLFQEGAQKIIGFDFRASLVMDMLESKRQRESKLKFALVESGMFSAFDGYWSVKPVGRYMKNGRVRCKTKLTYSVYVKPKGPVPVIALEWRIKEDVPVNLLAVKAAAENAVVKEGVEDDSSSIDEYMEDSSVDSSWSDMTKDLEADWMVDETLGSYM